MGVFYLIVEIAVAVAVLALAAAAFWTWHRRSVEHRRVALLEIATGIGDLLAAAEDPELKDGALDAVLARDLPRATRLAAGLGPAIEGMTVRLCAMGGALRAVLPQPPRRSGLLADAGSSVEMALQVRLAAADLGRALGAVPPRSGLAAA